MTRALWVTYLRAVGLLHVGLALLHDFLLWDEGEVLGGVGAVGQRRMRVECCGRPAVRVVVGSGGEPPESRVIVRSREAREGRGGCRQRSGDGEVAPSATCLQVVGSRRTRLVKRDGDARWQVRVSCARLERKRRKNERESPKCLQKRRGLKRRDLIFRPNTPRQEPYSSLPLFPEHRFVVRTPPVHRSQNSEPLLRVFPPVLQNRKLQFFARDAGSDFFFFCFGKCFP